MKKLVIFLCAFLLLSCDNKYSYIEIVKEKGLMNESYTEKSLNPETITAKNDSLAYLKAYEKFCISVYANKKASEAIGKSFGGPSSFKLLNSDGLDVYAATNIDPLAIKEIENSILKISSNNTIPDGGNSPVSSEENNIENAITFFSESTTPSYRIAKHENLDIKINGDIVKRVQLRIILPKDLSIEEVVDNFRFAALDFNKEINYNAISIMAYYNENEINGQYTIGMYELCPYGNWSRSTEKASIEKYKESYDIHKSYSDQINNNNIEINRVVSLNRKEQWDRNSQKFIKSTTAKMFDNPTNMGDEFLIKEFRNGTKAKVIDVFEKRLSGGSMWRSYKININGIEGWVSEFDIE